MEQAVTQSQVLFLLPQFVILGVWLCFMKKLRSNANLHGSARWAEEHDRQDHGGGGKGVSFRLKLRASEKHFGEHDGNCPAPAYP
jgi:hypothetical protein